MSQTPDPVIEIFNEALALAPAERAVYLETACQPAGSGLRQTVETLLSAHERAGVFLVEAVRVVQGGEASMSSVGEKPGDRVGKYELIEQIGEGGCGVVFLAEQREPVRRQVALKVVKPGMDTRSVIAQFESERQALAMMDHPHIARVFDAGATDAGRPYFVMELVRGVKITDYCDRQSLTTRARLELFIQVCHAIQHAHQKGIIHRDIKPSNILVATTGEDTPLPKVIDFGIAKATTGLRLTDKTFYTAFEMLIGTPAYMSPEQAAVASTDLDTRTDIYSLGVLLYELIVGEPPFDFRELFKLGLDEVRRGILTKQPVRPSVRLKGMVGVELTEAAQRRQTDPARLIRAVRGDLDWIVMKAVEKDRARRYPTANALAMDVQHFLADEPVLARPPGTLYQVRKLVVRNRLLVGSLSVFALMLMAGLAVTSVLLARERAARGQAEIEKQSALVEAAKSSQVSEFLGRMLSSVSPSVAMGRDTTILRELLGRTDQEIGTELKDQPEVEVALRLLLEQSYLEIGDIPAAERMLRRALQIYQTAPSPDRRQGAAVMTALGDLLIRENHYQEAESLLMSARGLWDELDAKEGKGKVNTMETIAILRSRQGRDDEAETLMRRVYAWRQKNLSPGDPDLNNALANLAVIVFAEKKYSEAEGMFRQVLETLQKLHGDVHPKLVTALRNLSRTVSMEGRNEEAREYLSRAVAVYRKCYQAAHPDRLRDTLELAGMDRGARAFAEAEPLYREVIENGGTPDDNPAQLRAAVGGLAITLQELNKTEEAIALFDKRLTAEALASPQCVPWLEMRAEFLARCGRWSQAAADATRLVEMEPGESEYYHLLAPLLVAAGDNESYRKLCREIPSRFAETKNLYVADRMAKDCLIQPGAVEDLAALERMADFALTAGASDVSLPLFRVCKALVQYRQGNFSGAAEMAKQVGSSLPDAEVEALAVRAMALRGMGQQEAARKSLAGCAAAFDARLPKLESGNLGEHWRDWIIARELREEAHSLIGGE